MSAIANVFLLYAYVHMTFLLDNTEFSNRAFLQRTFLWPVSDPELPSWAKGDVASYVPHVFTPDEHLQLRLAMFDAPENRYVTSHQNTRGAASRDPFMWPLRPSRVLQPFLTIISRRPADESV